jgi:phosphoribosylaminoimidazole carboxylase (NCAIR synthetase)
MGSSRRRHEQPSVVCVQLVSNPSPACSTPPTSLDYDAVRHARSHAYYRTEARAGKQAGHAAIVGSNIRKTRGILPSCGHELGVLGSNEDDYSLL